VGRNEQLVAYDRLPEFASWVMGKAGLTATLGEKQVWRVGDAAIVVELWRSDSLEYVLLVRREWPVASEPKSLCLAEAFAVATTQRVRRMRAPELSRWKWRALLEAGLVERPDVRLAALPEDASAAATATWRAIDLLLVARVLSGDAPTAPMPLVAPFLAGWGQLPEQTVRAGKLELEKRGFIRHVEDVSSNFPDRPTKLWAVRLDEPGWVDDGSPPSPEASSNAEPAQCLLFERDCSVDITAVHRAHETGHDE
jgi:hypothetical protein